MSASPPPWKIGVMSFAHTHAAGYVAHLRERPDVEVRAADPGGEVRGRELGDRLGVDYVDTYDELLAWGPDAVVVCTENARHREAVELAAAAGVHVLCEKPLATELDDATAMIAACESAGVALMTAFPVRFSPMFTALRDSVEAGRLGDIAGATGTNNGKIPVGDRSWFTNPELSGGGAIVDHTVHVADLLDALLGARAETVHCVSNRILHADEPQVRVETGGLVTISYDNGVVATIDCSWSVPDSAPTWGGVTLEIIGTKGAAAIAPFAQHVSGLDESTGRGVWLPFGADLDALMLDELLDAIRTGRRPRPDGRAGLRTLQIVKAAQRSAATGAPVTVR